MPKETNPRLKMSLRENGWHSFRRGIEIYQQYRDSEETSLLKEAIMFLHHGIELLMKEILVQESEYLIYEDLGRNTVKKQRQATKEDLGIFFLPKPPRTVTYLDAIDRVEAFINPPELTENLVSRLQELNQHRNQLEHYAIDVDAETVARLITNLHEPLATLFNARLEGVKQEEPDSISRTVREAEATVNEFRRLEQEVCTLIRKFDGQKIPGRLFGTSEELTLPDFSEGEVVSRYRPKELEGFEVDVFVQSGQTKWVVEVKVNFRPRAFFGALLQTAVNSEMLRARGWLIVFDNISEEAKQVASEQRILVTGAEEWDELKRIIGD